MRSLRSRLTFWYLAFFSLLYLGFCVLLYSLLAHSLERRVDEALTVNANTAAALLADEFLEENGDAARAASEVVVNLRLNTAVVAFLLESRLLAASAPLPAAELDELARRSDAETQPHALFGLAHAGAHGARAALARITLGGASYQVLALEPLDEVADDLARLRGVLLLALPLMIGLAGIGGYWLTARNLAPLAAMAEQAQRITGSNLETRLQIGAAAAELSLLAASFNELLARLDQSFEHMRRFVADASHELRTPVSVIRGEADVALAQDRDAAEYREALAVVLDESRRLSRLVDDLLNLARADAGRVKLHLEAFYLDDLLAECCRSAQSLASARGVSLECRSPDDVLFRGDEELIRRMAMNLIDNAIRYTAPGGGVQVELVPAPGALTIRFCDNGAGIAPETLPHVFERFYRGDGARTRQQGGFGLGLAIVKWIAESHGGTVEVASTPGAGSTFTVTLPAPAEP